MTDWLPTPIPAASLIHGLPSLLVLLAVCLLMLLAGECGFRAGCGQATSDGGRGHFGSVQASLLGLLTLLLGFPLIYVIHELDTPLTGISQAGQRPLIHLKKLIETQE